MQLSLPWRYAPQGSVSQVQTAKSHVYEGITYLPLVCWAAEPSSTHPQVLSYWCLRGYMFFPCSPVCVQLTELRCHPVEVQLGQTSCVECRTVASFVCPSACGQQCPGAAHRGDPEAAAPDAGAGEAFLSHPQAQEPLQDSCK